MKKFVIFLSLLLAVFVSAEQSAAMEKITFSSSSDGIDLTFNGFLSSCEITRVGFLANDSMIKEPEKFATSSVVINIEVIDTCDGDPVVFGASGYQLLQEEGLVVAKNLKEAYLSGSFAVNDRQGTLHILQVDIGCYAIEDGGLRTRNMSQSNGPLYRISTMFTGRSNGAICEGTVVLNGVNLTPFPSYQTQIIAGKGRHTFTTK